MYFVHSFIYIHIYIHSIIIDSIDEWLKRGVRGVWLKLPAESHSRLTADAISCGFELHHATKGCIVLTKWLPEMREGGEVSKLPEYASHYLGCGGLVLDIERGEVLLITERYQVSSVSQSASGELGQLRGHSNFNEGVREDSKQKHEYLPWKIPGGALDLGEDVADTAVREVFEETGIETEFLAVLGFRHMHNFRFGMGDIYFVCLLKALNRELKPDPREIGNCQWFPIDEYLAMDHLNMVQTAAQQALRQLIQDHDGDLTQIENSSRLVRTRDVSQYPGRKAIWYSSLS